MKTLLKLELIQAIWAWAGIILFLALGFAKLQASNQEAPIKDKPTVEILN